MKRFSLISNGSHDSVRHEEDENGFWVRFEDVETVLVDNTLMRRALTEITCCSSIQETAIIANGALLEFLPITDKDIEWAKSVAENKQ